mgnify:CR=1 FL=1
MQSKGQKVLLVDADPQGDLTTALGWTDAENLPVTLATQMQKILQDEPFAYEYMGHWLENEFRVRAKKYSTYYSYRNVINNHIIPVLGNKMMRTINSADIIRLYGSVNQYSSSVAKQVKTIMNALDSFILEVVPKIEEQNIVNDCSDIKIDISEFVPK